jgi:hypothetical protein
MKGLSIRQPWIYAIFNLGKNIENRDWYQNVSGRIVVHASGTCSKYDYEDGRDWIMSNIGLDEANKIPHRDALTLGAIVGTVDITGVCSTTSRLAEPSPWFVGAYGYILKNPVLLPEPIPFKGMLGFWDVPAEVEAVIHNQISQPMEKN